MKYTSYILGEDIINIDQMIAEKPVFKELTILLGIPVAIMGVVILTGALPMTVMIDGCRSLKVRYYTYMKTDSILYKAAVYKFINRLSLQFN